MRARWERRDGGEPVREPMMTEEMTTGSPKFRDIQGSNTANLSRGGQTPVVQTPRRTLAIG